MLNQDISPTSAALLDRLSSQEFLSGDIKIGAHWTRGDSRLEVSDPATGNVIGDFACISVDGVKEAIWHAGQAFAPWRGMLPQERGVLLRKWAALIREHKDDLALVITSEQGKPLTQSLSEVAYGAAFLDWFTAEGERAAGESLPAHKHNVSTTIRLQPIGITAAVTPWNCPLAMITRKAGAALAAGCPMIVKPASETPLTAGALARLAELAGIPDGVFQVVHGSPREVTAALLASEAVRAFSFTGSTAVGRILLRQAADTVKRVSLELGGNAPFIVFDDADIETAIAAAIAAKFSISGQDCLAANRIYVHRRLYERFVRRFADLAGSLRVGHGLDPATEIGPVTVASAKTKCFRLIEDAIQKGARLVLGDRTPSRGNFVSPTVLADVTRDMTLTKEEIFGPVAALIPFDDETEVLQLANETETGLAAYLFTNDHRRVQRLTDALEFGMVAVNTSSFTGPPVPFGGWKQAGLGREGGRAGLLEFLETKYVCSGEIYP